MKEKMVTTINNENIPQSLCRKFEGGWYKIGDVNIKNSGDCYLVDGQYYREETGRVVFNHRENKYVLKNDNLVEGIIEFDNTGYNLGFFTFNPDDVIVNTKSGNSYFLLDEKLIENNTNYREKLSNGEYYDVEILKSSDFNRIQVPNQEYKTSLPYDSKGITSAYLKQYDKNNPEINPELKELSKVLEDLTFGVEFETTKGIIPNRILNKTGLIPLRDGSISGIEYVTVPMSGAKGIYTLIKAVGELNTRTKFDNSCALHFHIGNVPRTKEFILAFFKLTLKFQNEIFEMFPLYKKYNFEVKRKNYSKPYDIYNFLSKMDKVINSNNIDENFNVLYKYLSQGQNFKDLGSDLRNVEFHPADPNGNQKWNIRNRYYFHNFIPLIFGNKETIEFRIHTPTYNVNKIVSFLIFNAILVNFTKKYQKYILENQSFLNQFGTTRDIVHTYLSESNIRKRSLLVDTICDYISKRISGTYSQSCSGKIVGEEEKIQHSRYINWEKYLRTSNCGLMTKDGSIISSVEELSALYREKRNMIVRQHGSGEIRIEIARRNIDEVDREFNLFKQALENNEKIEIGW